MWIALAFLLFSPSAAVSTDAGWVSIYSDSARFFNCVLWDQKSRTLKVYVVHEYPSSAQGSRFKIENSGGFTASYVGEESPFALVIGNTQDGIVINYFDCLSIFSYFQEKLSAED